MSLAEFLYPMMQAWDWWHLYRTKDITIQIGGSDQFGNILAGLDGINYMRSMEPLPLQLQQPEDLDQTAMPSHDMQSQGRGKEKPKTAIELQKMQKVPFGFTTPLLTTPSGEKFGKSAGNAIWLDKDLTSPFELYQVCKARFCPLHMKYTRHCPLTITHSTSCVFQTPKLRHTSNSSPSFLSHKSPRYSNLTMSTRPSASPSTNLQKKSLHWRTGLMLPSRLKISITRSSHTGLLHPAPLLIKPQCLSQKYIKATSPQLYLNPYLTWPQATKYSTTRVWSRRTVKLTP